LRDPNRIGTIIEKIEKIWRHRPDWRLGQLILNIVKIKCPELFYLEDDTILEKIGDLEKELGIDH